MMNEKWASSLETPCVKVTIFVGRTSMPSTPIVNAASCEKLVTAGTHMSPCTHLIPSGNLRILLMLHADAYHVDPTRIVDSMIVTMLPLRIALYLVLQSLAAVPGRNVTGWDSENYDFVYSKITQTLRS